VRIHLADALILLAKEAEGYPPVLAIDFEVLHGYLFPTVQSVTSRILPSCASYVIHNFPNRFVLPPGTAIELLRYTERYYGVLEELNGLIRHTELSSASREQVDRIRSLYEQVAPASTGGVVKCSSDSDIAIVANSLAEIAMGFQRLSRFVSDKVAPLDDYGDEWRSLYESNPELVSALAARLSAVQSLRSTRSRTSNENDARNIAAVLCIHRLQGERDARSRQHCSMQLLTETRPVLHLNLEDYGADIIAAEVLRKGRLNPEHFSQRRLPWIVTTLNSALVYCALRSAYGSALAAYREAKKQYVDLAELTVTVLRADAALSELSEREESAAAKRHVAQVLAGRGAARWYMPLRTTLAQGAVELASRLRMPARGHWDTLRSVRGLGMVEADLHQDHALSKLIVRPEGAEEPAAHADPCPIFGIQVEETTKGDLFPLMEWTASCRLTEERLITLTRWRDHRIVTAQWQANVNADQLLALLSAIISGLGEARGEVTAYYEYSPDDSGVLLKPEGPMPEGDFPPYRHEVLLALPSKRRLSPTMCIKMGSRVGQQSVVFPSFIALDSQVGDILVGLPFQSAREGPQAVCTISSAMGLDQLLGPLLSGSHGWRWLAPLLERFKAQVTRYLELPDNHWR
jgi:hypothetical protein